MAKKSNSILPYGFKALAERISAGYRQELNLTVNCPLDAFKLADHLEVPVECLTKTLTSEEVVRLIGTQSSPKDFSAMRMVNCDGDNIIIYNSRHSPYRQQSDIMHELAHIIRKHETPNDVLRLSYLCKLQSTNPVQEEEAKYLGACLQITRPGLLWALRRNFTYEQISTHFSASLDMVQYRVNSSGVLNQMKFSR